MKPFLWHHGHMLRTDGLVLAALFALYYWPILRWIVGAWLLIMVLLIVAFLRIAKQVR